MHDITLKTNKPIYVKQFKIPEAHREDIVVEARSSPTSSITLQQPTICGHKEKWRDPACSRFPSFERSLTHPKVLYEGCERVHRQDRQIRENAIQHHQSHSRILAKGFTSSLQALRRVHLAWQRPVQVDKVAWELQSHFSVLWGQ